MAKESPFTSEVVADMVEQYSAVRGDSYEMRDAVVQALAKQYKLTDRQIRGRLAREVMEDGEKLYIGKATVSKVTGETPAKKDEVAGELVALIEANVPYAEKQPRLSVGNIAKANKTDINGIMRAFKVVLARLNPEVETEADASNIGEAS